jgi:ABC-type branched-subunit amino acid transport system substrate-binding protein
MPAMGATTRAATAAFVLSALAACSVSTPRNGATVAAGSATQPGTASAVVAGEDLAPGTPVVAGEEGSGAELTAAAAPTGDGGGAVAASSEGSTASASETGAPVERVASAPGVTADTITVSVVAGFSGPLAAMVTRAYDGLATWMEDVNESGGINGREVVLQKVDHKETADGGVAACKDVQSNGSFVAMVPEGVEATLTAVSCLDAAGIPTYYYAPTVDPSWQRAFSNTPTSEQGGHQLASYVAGPLGGRGKKVGVIYVNQASYKAAADAFVPEAKRLGVDVADVEAVEPNQASFTAPLLRMQDAGVEIIVISATAEAIGIVRDARGLGYDGALTGWGFQFDFITAAARDMFSGVTGLRSFAATDSAAFEAYAERMAARGRGRDRVDDLEGFTAYGHGLSIGAVLAAAGANPTRESVVRGSETIRDFDNGVMAPFSWSPDDHVGAHGTFPIVCCNADYTWKSAGAPGTSFG